MHPSEEAMLDIIFIAVTVAFFALGIVYAGAMEKL